MSDPVASGSGLAGVSSSGPHRLCSGCQSGLQPHLKAQRVSSKLTCVAVHGPQKLCFRRMGFSTGLPHNMRPVGIQDLIRKGNIGMSL